MPAIYDPELEHFKRAIDLVEYAKKTGYEVRPEGTGSAAALLEHPSRDRIVVARAPNGAWIYASVNAYEPAAPGESPDSAARRLRDCIRASQDKGTIVEFVQQRDWTAPRAEVPLDVVRERLREYRDAGLPLDFEGALTSRTTGRTMRAGVDVAADGPRTVGAGLGPGDSARGVDGPGSKPDLSRRRYDWTPSPPEPPEVEQRLRQWREAQAAIDPRPVAQTREPREHAPSATVAVPPPVDRAQTPVLPPPDRGPSPEKSELNRRRYDWSPPPDVLGVIARAPRGRGPDRGR